jgi:hypothetical protein
VAISAYLNDIPKPVWIAAMVVGFIWHWPIGLAVLAYLLGSGRIGGRRMNGPGRWDNTGDEQTKRQNAWGSWGCGCGSRRQATPSGNTAFDDYRAETLRRLEEEQKEFVEYLNRLRQAKDKAEFDQFMADRRRPPVPTENQ